MQLLPHAAMEMLMFYQPATYVLKLDSAGRLVKSLHDPTARVVGGLVTQVTEHEGHLYLGSVMFNYVTRVDLRAAGLLKA